MTTILYEQPVSVYLKNCDGKEKDIVFEQEEFIIGKVASVTNAQINNNAISRMHAKFYKKEDGWKIMDLCSTNGTYLNGERLRGEKEYVLKDGDQIRLANIEYRFCVK
jgi:pSer/pThr/pTyr-binding forkhead associated (FHA) protein